MAVSYLLIAAGLWMMLTPKSALKFKVWVAKQAGAKLTVGKKTAQTIQLLGVLLAVLGVAMWLWKSY